MLLKYEIQRIYSLLSLLLIFFEINEHSKYIAIS